MGSEDGEKEKLRKENNGKEREGMGNATGLELNNRDNRVTGA